MPVAQLGTMRSCPPAASQAPSSRSPAHHPGSVVSVFPLPPCLTLHSARGAWAKPPRSRAFPRDLAFLSNPGAWRGGQVAELRLLRCSQGPCALPRASWRADRRRCPAGCGCDTCVEENPGHFGSSAQCLCPSLTFKEGNCSFQQTTLRSVAALAQFSDGRQTEAALETKPQPSWAWPTLCPQSRVPAAQEAAWQSARPACL